MDGLGHWASGWEIDVDVEVFVVLLHFVVPFVDKECVCESPLSIERSDRTAALCLLARVLGFISRAIEAWSRDRPATKRSKIISW